MLFTPKNADLVMQGAKTQTRREVNQDDHAIIINGQITAIERGTRLLWAVDRIYAVQPGRGKHGIGRVVITEIRKQKLQDISDGDICAELGCPAAWTGPDPEPYKRNLRAAFEVLWDSINSRGHRWYDNRQVWALTLKIV